MVSIATTDRTNDMNTRLLFLIGFLAWFAALSPASSRASAQGLQRSSYRLLDGSALYDDCPICGRPTIAYTLRGTFDLVLAEQNPLFNTYLITNVQFQAIGANGYKITGNGRYQLGGEVAIRQQLVLDLFLDSQPVSFTNDTPTPDKLFPLLSIRSTETTPTLLQVFTLNLVAAPVREIWFSTVSGFTPASGGPRGSGGDLLSSDGRVVKPVSHFSRALGLPDDKELQLDAFDLQAGGEILFSLAENQPISNLGPLYQGDLLSDRGRIVKRNQELTAAFGFMPPSPDVGLDAITSLADGEFLFSIRTNMFSERLGRMLRRGDLLSSGGTVVASNQQLLSRFHPETTGDFGLDALFVWPGGEIWFSVEDGFQDRELGAIGAGDLLSNQGIVVYRNLELMSAFAPIEDLADFGLDGLFVVTDLNVVSTPPHLTNIRKSNVMTHLEWEGPGRVFQVMRSGRVQGPFEPASPIVPDLSFDVDEAMGADLPTGFYQVRQW